MVARTSLCFALQLPHLQLLAEVFLHGKHMRDKVVVQLAMENVPVSPTYRTWPLHVPGSSRSPISSLLPQYSEQLHLLLALLLILGNATYDVSAMAV